MRYLDDKGPHSMMTKTIFVKDAWLKALKEERAKGEIPWINLLDQGLDSPSASLYGVIALPDNFLIAKDGTIVGRNMREWDIERVVRAKLDASGPSGTSR